MLSYEEGYMRDSERKINDIRIENRDRKIKDLEVALSYAQRERDDMIDEVVELKKQLNGETIGA